MERKLKETIVFEEDITQKELSELPKDFNGKIIVKGNVNISNSFYFPCDLFIIGRIKCKEIKVNGNFYLEGSINSIKLHCIKDFYFKENGAGSSIENIKVEGNCSCEVGDFGFDSMNVLGNIELKRYQKGKLTQEIKAKSIVIDTIQM